MWRLSRGGLLLLGGGGGRGSLPSRQNAEPPAPQVCMCGRRAAAARQSPRWRRVKVGVGGGGGQSEEGPQRPEHALHATVPCPACGGGALPTGSLRQPGKASPRALPSARGAAWGPRACEGGRLRRSATPGGGVLGGRRTGERERGRRSGGESPRPVPPRPVPPPSAARSLRCRRGAERQVAGASGEGASPAPSPAIRRSQSGPVPGGRRRRRVPGGRPGAGERPPPTRRGALPRRNSRGRAGGARGGRPSSGAPEVGEPVAVNERSLSAFREKSSALPQSRRGRSAGLRCPPVALALEGARSSCAEPDGCCRHLSGRHLREQSLGSTPGGTALAASPAAGLPGSRRTAPSSPARQLPPGSSEGCLRPPVGRTPGPGGGTPSPSSSHGCPAGWYRRPPPPAGGGHPVESHGRRQLTLAGRNLADCKRPKGTAGVFSVSRRTPGEERGGGPCFACPHTRSCAGRVSPRCPAAGGTVGGGGTAGAAGGQRGSRSLPAAVPVAVPVAVAARGWEGRLLSPPRAGPER